MLVSTFELLVKSQLPKEFPPPAPFDKLGRTVIQGYFLTIANTSSSDVVVSLAFTSITPTVDIDKTFTFLDVTGANIPGDLVPDTVPGKARFTIPLPANDTCLFILQPDILKDGGKLLKDANFEVRGYAEIGLSSLSRDRDRDIKLLLTPEHRGTFFNGKIVDDPTAELRLDQFVCSLPLAKSSALYKLRGEDKREDED